MRHGMTGTRGGTRMRTYGTSGWQHHRQRGATGRSALPGDGGYSPSDVGVDVLGSNSNTEGRSTRWEQKRMLKSFGGATRHFKRATSPPSTTSWPTIACGTFPAGDS